MSSRLLGGWDAVEAVAEVDDLGYGALWIGSAPGDLELVERLLAGTPRIVVATGIVNVWTEPADVTAAAYARVSAAYPDRLLLGLGAGHKALVEAQTDQKYVRPYHKVVAYLDALDAADPPVPRQGRVLPVDDSRPVLPNGRIQRRVRRRQQTIRPCKAKHFVTSASIRSFFWRCHPVLRRSAPQTAIRDHREVKFDCRSYVRGIQWFGLQSTSKLDTFMHRQGGADQSIFIEP